MVCGRKSPRRNLRAEVLFGNFENTHSAFSQQLDHYNSYYSIMDSPILSTLKADDSSLNSSPLVSSLIPSPSRHHDGPCTPNARQCTQCWNTFCGVCGDGVANYGAGCCSRPIDDSLVLFSRSCSDDKKKVGGKQKGNKDRRRQRRLKSSSSSPLPADNPVPDVDESHLYDFLLCNYLLFKCGKLGNEQKRLLHELNVSWIEHVEKQEKLPVMEGVVMSVKSTVEFARDRFADNLDVLLMFESMLESGGW